MAEPAKSKVAPTPTPASEPEPELTAHGNAVCPVAWCPICIAVGAVQPIRPEVVEHLLKAGTELLLAFRGVIDARAEGYEEADAGSPTRLEKIELG